jgi:fused signal recognition particle receptor
MFNFIKNTLKKVYSTFTTKAQALFAKPVDEQTLSELETLLLAADTGVKTTRTIIANLRKEIQSGKIAQGSDLKEALEEQLFVILDQTNKVPQGSVYVLVGINGSGKTTFAGKLAHHLKSQEKKVLMVAGDTFRAAATAQLNEWANRTGADIVIGADNQDPASVIFAGCEKFKNSSYDALIIDTAGRLQTKANLMRELEKIKKVIIRQLPNHTVVTLLTVDSMLGQNSFEQARLFHESTNLDGIVLTKMDGTGGIVFSITQELGIPVAYLSFGEQPDQLAVFDAHEYVRQLLQ